MIFQGPFHSLSSCEISVKYYVIFPTYFTVPYLITPARIYSQHHVGSCPDRSSFGEPPCDTGHPLSPPEPPHGTRGPGVLVSPRYVRHNPARKRTPSRGGFV